MRFESTGQILPVPPRQ